MSSLISTASPEEMDRNTKLRATSGTTNIHQLASLLVGISIPSLIACLSAYYLDLPVYLIFLVFGAQEFTTNESDHNLYMQ